jgi:hypothetical protein
MKKIIKKIVKKPQEVPMGVASANGIFAEGNDFIVRWNGQEEKYSGSDAFAIAAKRFRIMRGF